MGPVRRTISLICASALLLASLLISTSALSGWSDAPIVGQTSDNSRALADCLQAADQIGPSLTVEGYQQAECMLAFTGMMSRAGDGYSNI